MAVTKTAAEIRELMDSWRDDPTWQVEHTKGFEGYFTLLAAYRSACDRRDTGAAEKSRLDEERRALERQVCELARRAADLAAVERHLDTEARALVPQGDEPVEPDAADELPF